MATALSTENDAVNAILATINESPITSTQFNETDEIKLAYACFQEENRAVQSEGWYWNTQRDKTFTPDGSGFLNVTADMINVLVPKGCYYDERPVRRQVRMWNSRDWTNVFTRALKFDVVYLLNFPDLSEQARRYVWLRAARTFQARVRGDQVSHTITEQMVADARSALVAHETEASGSNAITSSPDIQYAFRNHY